MMTPKIGAGPRLEVQTTRPRETPRQGISFQQMLHGGSKLLLAGAEIAGGLVGGPWLAAAVARARSGAGAAAGSETGTASGGAASDGLDPLRALQQERLSEELRLIALQNQVQRHDRQVSLTSNLLKARHDTAKQAINNIRS